MRQRAAQAAVVGVKYGGGFRHDHRAASTHPRADREPGPISRRLATVDRRLAIPYFPAMTATEIIREMDCLPPAELVKVVRHVKQLEVVRQLSPEELGVLVDEFVEATEPVKVEQLREKITEGFYGRR